VKENQESLFISDTLVFILVLAYCIIINNQIRCIDELIFARVSHYRRLRWWR